MVYYINYFIFAIYLRHNKRILKNRTAWNSRTPPRTNAAFSAAGSRRITTYLVVCAFLAFVNWQTSPHYWWVAWVAAGWGLNLVLSLVWYLTDCDDENNYR